MVIVQCLTRCLSSRFLLILTSLEMLAGFALLISWQNIQLPLWRFIPGAILCSSSYTMGIIVLLSLYCIILDDKDQGRMMTWFNGSGALARVTIPIISSYLFDIGGDF